MCPPMLHQDDAQSRYDRFLETYLSGELKLVNAGLPRARKSLADLLEEEQPSVFCSDGTHQMLKRAELRYLQGILDDDEQRSLMLPMIIEMTGSDTVVSYQRRVAGGGRSAGNGASPGRAWTGASLSAAIVRVEAKAQNSNAVRIVGSCARIAPTSLTNDIEIGNN